MNPRAKNSRDADVNPLGRSVARSFSPRRSLIGERERHDSRPDGEGEISIGHHHVRMRSVQATTRPSVLPCRGFMYIHSRIYVPECAKYSPRPGSHSTLVLAIIAHSLYPRLIKRGSPSASTPVPHSASSAIPTDESVNYRPADSRRRRRRGSDTTLGHRDLLWYFRVHSCRCDCESGSCNFLSFFDGGNVFFLFFG